MRKAGRNCFLPALLSLLFLPAEKGRAGDVLVVKAKRVYTVSGKVLSPGVVVIKGDRIDLVATELKEEPKNAKVLSAAVVIPGLVEAESRVGLRGPLNEESSEITPRVKIADAFEPTDPSLRKALSRGITTVLLTPGDRNVVGGLCALAKTYAGGGKFVLDDAAALKAVLGPAPAAGNRGYGWGPPRDLFFRRPTTRMAVVELFREALNRGRDVLEGKRKPAPELVLLSRVVKGELPLHVTAGRVIDIRALLKETRKHGVTPVIVDGWEAYKVAGKLSERRIPVVLTPSAAGLLAVDPGGERVLDSPARLAAAGVKIAFAAAGADVDPFLTASVAVRFGLPEPEALRALTLSPCEILGIEKEYGTVEKGKKADLVLLSGAPFSATTRVLKVIGAGKIVFPEGGGR